MSQSALFVVGGQRFVATMRRAGADLDELRQVNAQAAKTALPAVQARVPRRSGRLAGSLRTGATRKAGVVRAGRASIPYAGVINYGWPARGIVGRLYANDGVAASEPSWSRLYRDFVKKTLSQVKGT